MTTHVQKIQHHGSIHSWDIAYLSLGITFGMSRYVPDYTHMNGLNQINVFMYA